VIDAGLFTPCSGQTTTMKTNIVQATTPIAVDLGTAAVLAFFACPTDMHLLLIPHRDGADGFHRHDQRDVFRCAARQLPCDRRNGTSRWLS
jgi:hypothetical protein